MPDQPIRYQLGDHICSTSATVGADGVLLNREEYLPYGETAFGSYARKRYRYTGKERDAESGCSYHGRRYYLTWLARWNSCDPCLPRTGTNAYRYCASNPTKFVDPTGGYEQAGHYYTVYFASLAVGFSPVVAARNAFWAQLPDQLDRLDAFAQEVQSWSPFADSNQQNWRDHVQRDIHALTGGESRPERLATTERITQGTPGTAGYGDLLHRLGDSYAHSLIDHETRLYSTGLGHAKDGHSPDKVEVRPSLYLDYTMALYGALASSASKLGLKPRMSPFEFHSWAQQVSKEPDASSQISYIRKSAAVQFAESHGLSEYAPELHEPTSLEQLRNDRYTGNMLRGVDINQINAAIPNSDSHIPAASLTR
jgi:RHS repeat-associated protein